MTAAVPHLDRPHAPCYVRPAMVTEASLVTLAGDPPAAVRRRDIRTMFDRVASRYDLMNDLMSLGVHRLWKHRLAALAGDGPGLAVDLAGGTGDIARRLADRGWAVTVCDPSAGMMAAGRARAASHGLGWVAGFAEALPFPDDRLDLLTIAFGLRNVTERAPALTEMRRVLRPGGRLLCLEFSRAAPWLRPFYDPYSRHAIPRLGALVAGRREAYRYLVDSIRAFPDQDSLAAAMAAQGFEDVTYRNLSFGIAAIHAGRKLH